MTRKRNTYLFKRTQVVPSVLCAFNNVPPRREKRPIPHATGAGEKLPNTPYDSTQARVCTYVDGEAPPAKECCAEHGHLEPRPAELDCLFHGSFAGLQRHRLSGEHVTQLGVQESMHSEWKKGLGNEAMVSLRWRNKGRRMSSARGQAGAVWNTLDVSQPHKACKHPTATRNGRMHRRHATRQK